MYTTVRYHVTQITLQFLPTFGLTCLDHHLKKSTNPKGYTSTDVLSVHILRPAYKQSDNLKQSEKCILTSSYETPL